MSITRTTISLDDSLLATARQLAAGENRTLGQFVAEALRHHIASRATTSPRAVTLPTSGQGGLKPGVNLNSNAAISDLLDDEDVTRWSSPM